ncbi:MAG: hypothetical protein J1F12_05115 [Muribaculaceae bacterium]|nr:hypothetical protein [Muribaculaceae bacterium]
MKQKISYSSVISGLSIAYFVVFVAIFVLFWCFIDKPYDNVFFWILFGLFCLGIVWICGSIPYSVSADDDYVGEDRPFRSRRYRYSDIQSAEKADKDDYSAYDKGMHFHGKYKEPVLITLKDGRKFVIGSDNSKELIDYINSRVS